MMVAEELRQIMSQLGFRTVNEMIGRVDVLGKERSLQHWKARGLDLSPMLMPAQIIYEHTGVYKMIDQDHGLEDALDNELIRLAEPALAHGEKVTIELPVINTNRVVGTMLSHQIALRCGAEGLPDDNINIKLNGSAGQSIGAFLAKGVTIEVEGDANDYVGKGLSGGKIIIYPHRESTFKAEANILAGNVLLYGATSGEAYFRGIAAERFCVRNSGAIAVVEGAGDHACEYMTGGRAVMLGPPGRNFGAGMSGGMAYIWDEQKTFRRQCNLGSIELEPLIAEYDVQELQVRIQNHFQYTKSTVAERILESWGESLQHFVKVMPVDYKRVLLEMAASEEATAVG